MSKAELLKSVIKKNVGEKPTFGTDPKDPWSAKANIAEDAALDQYLVSRGINPKHVTKDQKVAHSKMGQFLKWKRDHLGEAVDKKDTVTFDIPLLIRVLEFAREDLKSDILLHKMVERLISMRGKGTLTMDQYGRIIKEEAEALGESEYGPRADKLLKHSHDLYHKSRSESDPEKKQSMVKMSSKAHKVFMKAKEQHFKRNPDAYKAHVDKMMSGAAQDYKDQEKKRGIGHVRDHIEVDGEVVSEVSSELLDRYKKGAMKSATDLAAKGDYKKSNDRLLGHMKATGKQIDKTTASIKKSLNKEETVSEVAPPGFEGTVKAMKKHKDIDNPWALAWSMKNKGYKSHKKADGTPKNESVQDPKAADPMPCDCANSPNDVAPKNKSKKLIQMSKSARIIKSIYNKKGVKQEAKEAKLKNVITDLEQPKAAAVLTGGTTMTGEKRDTIEIDPMMKKGKPISGKR